MADGQRRASKRTKAEDGISACRSGQPAPTGAAVTGWSPVLWSKLATASARLPFPPEARRARQT
ncbi:unnamed protein product, partial [Laminaria digitata]